MSAACPLCLNPSPFAPVPGPIGRKYYLCPRCNLIHVAKEFLPTRDVEEARYKTHQNGPQHTGYLQFLNQAITPARPYLNDKMRGLDYGCGPVPTLSGMLKADGLACADFDPSFFPAPLQGPYDFIFATEVIEHFFDPRAELAKICGLLARGGIFTIMTEPWTTPEVFSHWRYANDITHVCFYHPKTIDYICAEFGFEILNHSNPRVWVLKK